MQNKQDISGTPEWKARSAYASIAVCDSARTSAIISPSLRRVAVRHYALKTLVFLLPFLFLSSSFAFAQGEDAEEVLIDNFESGDLGWAPVDPGWVDFEIVDNPAPDAVNGSGKVLKVTRHAGTATYAGVILRNRPELTFGALQGQYRFGHVKVLKTAGSTVAFKLEKNGNDGSYTASGSYAPSGQWQELTFDFGGAAGTNYDDFFIMPDQTENPAQNIEVYLDDIVMKTDPNVGETGPIELPGTFRLLWADEFNGDSYDPDIWSPQVRGDGFGNNELQYYTGLERNIFTDGENLILKVYKEPYQNRNYTSGKLWGQNKKPFKYGRVEVRFKLPAGRGTWPAIWMMPQNSVYGGWPNSGEIDIMEFVGYQPSTIYGTVHRGAGSGGNGNGSNISIAGKTGEFHVIRIDWEPGYIKWYLNDQLFHTYNNGFAGPAQWPFDQEFYVILNFAVGGDWGGAQGVDDSIWPQEFLIDYVRVYQKSEEGTSLVPPFGDSPFTVLQRSDNELEASASMVHPATLAIYSLTGQKQFSQTVTGEKTPVNISALPKGIYIVTLKDGIYAFSKKIIK
jgi:beta-glucanase (GH16 family)